MKTIYELQQIANRLRQVTEADSISPEDAFGLQSDILEYLADMEQNANGLGIHKVYASYADMVADSEAPVGTNGKALRFGQLVAIYDASNSTQEESGNVYAWQRGNTTAPWLLMGNLGSVYVLQAQLTALGASLTTETMNRQNGDNDLLSRINSLSTTLTTLTREDLSEAIENFNEIISFLEGVSDDNKLTSMLQNVQNTLTTIHTLRSRGYRFRGIALPNTQPGTVEQSECYLAYTSGEYVNFLDGETEAITLGEDEVALLTYDMPQQEGTGWVKTLLDISTKSRVDAILSSIGQAGGIAPLNASGKIDDRYIKQEVITLSRWAETTDVPASEGLYWYNPLTKKLYVSEVAGNDFEYVETTIDGSTIYVHPESNVPYVWKNNDMAAIAPKDSPASIFNATNEIPIQGYYVLYDSNDTSMSAVHAAWEAGKSVSGLIISFEIGAGIWKTYQYIGKTVTQANWTNEENWKDFGSLAAGSEPYVIIDSLVGAPAVGTYYTLATAVQALIAYQERTKVSYAKKGLIISYANGENSMETKQFQGEVTDFGLVALWKDFGGGNAVETSDTAEENGTDALSTGGAYNLIPTGLKVDTETEGVIKLQMENAAGEGVGDEIQFPVGTGSGGGSGTTIAIAYENNPVYGRAGGQFIVRAAIMSITKAGSQETPNSIMNVTFVNRTTKKTVAVFNPKKASSASLADFSFSFDLSSLGSSSGGLPLQAIVTDDGGNTATKNISVIAVDVTCESVQTLNYTRDTTLEVGGSAKNIPMYRFPNNASDRGILVKVEIYKGGEWQQLTTATIMDTYSHNVLISPSGLAHGAYPIRIQGEDVSSGVKGNVLHTSIMVIQQDETLADYNTPIVAARWSDDSNGEKKLFESIRLDVACYQRDEFSPLVEVKVNNVTKGTTHAVAEQVMMRTTTYTISKRLNEFDDGDTLVFYAQCGQSTQPENYELDINGSLLPISETEGAFFEIDFASRSNSDNDKSIVAECSDTSEVEISLHGANYSSNGFVKDSYGTTNYGTVNDTGRMALRIAEDVTATSDIRPYANAAVETNGSALSFTTQVKNVADPTALLMKCMGEKMGFILSGEKLVVYTNGDPTDASTSCTVPYALDMVHRFDIVVEPSSIAPYGGIGVIKVFKDGDEVGAVKYPSGDFPNTDAAIEWDGTDADIYLYNIKMWNTYYNFIQAFQNYLIGLTDTEAMITEYEKNDVMSSQTAEGTTKDRPDMQKFLDAGIPVVVLTKNPTTDDIAKNYPDYLEGLDGDKKTTIPLDWYCYFPGREWQNCIISNDPTSNQGTTSSWRKIKNKKAKHKKATGGMQLMYTREEIAEMYPNNEEVLAKYDLAASMARKNKLQVVDGGQFTNITTIKVDYSDSCGAHNGAMMDLMNDTQIALGEKYMTPAQNYNEGDFEIHTSIDSIPCALFRTDHFMTAQEAVDPAHAYFHAKANFNADKGDAAFYGFEKTNGYNASCLNYGDFIELVAAPNQTLTAFKAAVLADTSNLVAGNIYVLSEYCGPDHIVLENDGSGSMEVCGAVDNPTETELTLAEVQAASVDDFDWDKVYLTADNVFVQYQGGVWQDTTGDMTFNNSTKKWSVSGRVVNPVECYELLKYDSLCWMQGVNSVSDMMQIDSTTGNPVWMSYFESRYPDDDDLNELYENGQKAPYQLFRWLQFCQQCNQHLTAVDGDITVDGETVAGTAANRLLKWEHELHKYANVHSLLCYTVASDYKACVDQRSKNMMIAFYLEPTGTMRAYLNHWYDGDCVDGSDNDCGLTIPWDMDARTSHLYQGWDSVIFQQCYAAGDIWLDDGGNTTISLSEVAGAMRKAERNNIKVFSAEGCYYYWVTKRLAKWAKVVSSFDGERKYIQNSTASDNYFFALHGLRLDDLPDYQRKRFKYCDGQYQVGDLYTNPFKARMMGPIEITIMAAQDGFFGLGEDRADACADSCHLLAGQSYTMTVNAAQESGKMIYIFGADKLSKLDISHCTPKLEAFSLEYCTLLEELVIGSADYTPAYTTGVLSALELPAMPFLKKLDIRNTRITSVTAKNCPRLRTILAEGTPLRSITLPESAPLTTLQLPATMTSLSFANIPTLSYPGGLTFDGLGHIGKVYVHNCPNIDVCQLLITAINAGSIIQQIHLDGLTCTGPSSILSALMSAGATGLDNDGKPYEETGQCSGLTGRWVMTDFVTSATLAALQAYFPMMEIHNSQFSHICFDDTEDDPENISNLDNATGYQYGNSYQPSAHINQIWEDMKPVIGLYNSSTGEMSCIPLDERNYRLLADGRTLDNTYDKGEYDSFMLIPHYWYKGVNDFKHEKKHLFFSSVPNTPLSSASVQRRVQLSDILFQSGCSVCTDSIYTNIYDENHELNIDGMTTLIRTNSSYNTYRLDVEGMKLVRWPGVASSRIGAIFVDEEGNVIDAFNLTGVSNDCDFADGDYVFTQVPDGAKYIIFAVKISYANDYALAVDSDNIEAMEPDWVEHAPELVGLYGAAMLDGTLRSVPGVAAKLGDGTTTTYEGWAYDSDGHISHMDPVDVADLELHYTMKDFQNLAWLRGAGYQMIDYETSKDIANLFFAIVGNRDAQDVCGQGRSVSSSANNGFTNNYNTGLFDSIGKANSQWSASAGNKVLGIENFMACNAEWMDNVAVGVTSFAHFKRNRMLSGAGYSGDAVWHIYNPLTNTERTVQGLSEYGYCIGRVKFGRYADIIASKVTSDNSRWNQNYCDGLYGSSGTGRVVYRAHNNANAFGGLVYANTSYVSSYSYTYIGTRLAFRGAIRLITT